MTRYYENQSKHRATDSISLCVLSPQGKDYRWTIFLSYKFMFGPIIAQRTATTVQSDWADWIYFNWNLQSKASHSPIMHSLFCSTLQGIGLIQHHVVYLEEGKNYFFTVKKCATSSMSIKTLYLWFICNVLKLGWKHLKKSDTILGNNTF